MPGICHQAIRINGHGSNKPRPCQDTPLGSKVPEEQREKGIKEDPGGPGLDWFQTMRDNERKSESAYFKEELWGMIVTRYGNMSAYETIGVLETVKFEMIEALPKRKNDNH